MLDWTFRSKKLEVLGWIQTMSCFHELLLIRHLKPFSKKHLALCCPRMSTFPILLSSSLNFSSFYFPICFFFNRQSPTKYAENKPLAPTQKLFESPDFMLDTCNLKFKIFSVFVIFSEAFMNITHRMIHCFQAVTCACFQEGVFILELKLHS